MRSASLVAVLLVLTPLASAAVPIFTLRIAGVEGERIAGEVRVTVHLAGTSVDLFSLVPTPISGEASVTTPTPCWPDFTGGCADVITTKTQPFFLLPLGATWGTDVGPFRYPAAVAGLACERLDVEARARQGEISASDAGSFTVCA